MRCADCGAQLASRLRKFAFTKSSCKLSQNKIPRDLEAKREIDRKGIREKRRKQMIPPSNKQIRVAGSGDWRASANRIYADALFTLSVLV